MTTCNNVFLEKDDSEKIAASIFRVEDYAKHETKQKGTGRLERPAV
jgi:hypothetical protein